ncbi:MAG: oligosaccharide flippase family protein [Pirellulaceae bacterium]|nr:oligosaccharide flippase family protein [Pirellulaceae bacterium]
MFRPTLARIEASPLGARLARGVFWSIAGAVISRGLMLVATIVVARLLGKTVFGELGIIQSTVGMFGVFAGFGLGVTATKHVAEFREKDPARAGRIIVIAWLVAAVSGGLLALGLLLFAPWLAAHTLNAPHLAGVLRIGALILFISAVNSAQTGALAGFEAFRTIARVNLIAGLLSFPMLIAGAYVGGLTGAVWALAINLAINWLLNHLALRQEAARCRVPLRFKNCRQELPVLWRFSLPAVLAGSMVGPVNWACGAMLVHQPNGYAEMGVFNAANQWRLTILFIPSLLATVVLPLLTNLDASANTREYRRILKLNTLLNGGVALAFILPLVLFADTIMQIYGPGYSDEGANVLRVLATTAFLMAVSNVVGSAIASKGRMWIGFTFNALWAIVLMAASAVLLDLGYGALGLAYATLISYVFHTVLQTLYAIGFCYSEPSAVHAESRLAS